MSEQNSTTHYNEKYLRIDSLIQNLILMLSTNSDTNTCKWIKEHIPDINSLPAFVDVSDYDIKSLHYGSLENARLSSVILQCAISPLALETKLTGEPVFRHSITKPPRTKSLEILLEILTIKSIEHEALILACTLNHDILINLFCEKYRDDVELHAKALYKQALKNGSIDVINALHASGIPIGGTKPPQTYFDALDYTDDEIRMWGLQNVIEASLSDVILHVRHKADIRALMKFRRIAPLELLNTISKDNPKTKDVRIMILDVISEAF